MNKPILYKKFRYKGCDKCGGDMMLDRDIDGWYESCLMCGKIMYIKGGDNEMLKDLKDISPKK
jgi:hypothetical protein